MKKLKRFGKQVMIALLLVSLNINPIGTVAGAIYESGAIDRASNLGQRLYAMATGTINDVKAANADGSGQTPSSTVVNVSCDCDHQEIPISGGKVQVYDSDNYAVNRTSMERLGHISGKMTDLIDEVITTRVSMMEGFNRIESQLIQVNEKLDIILSSLHHYRVAHVYSLNNVFGNSLYRPHTEDVPYVEDYVTITGQFANVYMGYWDANVPDVVNPIQASRALEVLGYDAILRAEGVQVVAPEVLQEKNTERLHSLDNVTGESTLSTAFQFKHVPTEEELEVYNNLTEEEKEVYGIHPENNTVTPNGEYVKLIQEFIPESNVTWLDAVTVLYKALDQEVFTYQSIYTRNREITPENSPLSQKLSGVKEFEGYDYYVFSTRNNVIEGDGHNNQTTYLYWLKAINDGVVNWEDRDTPIAAWEFYGLATSLMEAYGEPVMNEDEIKALLQVYGDEYPVQLGTDIADDWAYLKARGVLAKDLGLDISDNLSREQLLDICMRIKDKTAREDYKSIQISLDIGQLMRDNGYYPVYDLDWGVNEFSSTNIIDYAAMSDYTYLLAAPAELSLNTLGMGAIYSKPEFDESKIIPGAYYNGIMQVDGKYYYRVSVPKSWNENFYLGFTYILDESQRNGNNDFIEVTSSNLGGGIYTAYTVKDKIATVDKKQEGTNYFKFNHRSEDKELRRFADIDRCDISETEVAKVSYGVSINADPFSKALAFVDEMTSPIVVQAGFWDNALSFVRNIFVKQTANTGTNTPKTNTAQSNGTPAWADEVTGYNPGASNVQYSTGIDQFNKLSNLGGVDICLDGSEVYIPMNSFATSLSRMNAMNTAIKGFTNTPGSGTKQSQLKSSLENNSMPGFWTNFTLGIGSQKAFNELNSGLDNATAMTYGGISALENSPQWKYATMLEVTGPTISGDTALYSVKSDSNEKLISGLDALYGSKEQSGTEVVEGVEDSWSELNYDVTTDTIMSRDENLLISWSALKEAGLAWSISKTSDNYTYDEKNGTYTFMTACGSVLINEVYQFMQVGTTLYTFQNGDKPANLVYVDPNLSEAGYQEVYFDVRCVLGLTTRRFEPLGNTEVVEQTKTVALAVGDDASYSINPDQFVGLGSEEIFAHKRTAISNFPDIPGNSNVHTNVKPFDINVITSTIYDGLEVGEGKYWDGVKGSRVSMSHFNPTANYVLCIADTGGSGIGTNGIQASLFVYYLKEAFTEGIDNDGDGFKDGAIDGSKWNNYFKEQYKTATSNLAQTQYASNKSTLNEIAKSYGQYESMDAMGESAKWYDVMTAAALTDLFAYTGRVYIEQDYVVREFDLTSNYLAGVNEVQSLDTTPDPDKAISPNKPGYCYWVPNTGFVYNLPTVEEFNLTDYYKGKYILPLAIGSTGVISFNLNNYVKFKSTAGEIEVPIGWELTDAGYQHYKDSKATLGSNPVTAGSSASTEITPFEVSTFVPAPVGVYSRYGIWRQDEIHTIAAENLTSAYTDSEAIYYGSRRVYANDATIGDDIYAFTYGCASYNPIGLAGNTKAYICMQYQSASGRTYAAYVMPRTSMIEGVGDMLTDVREIPVYSEDEVDWSGKAKMEHILDSIDSGTNWLMYLVFTIAPMICVIVMTILIGLSFLTDSKVWQVFCDKCFDPVRYLTLGARDSNSWHWRQVLIPCIITYIAFALFCNANFLKIIIWVVDAWVRLTAFIKF